MRVPQKAVEGQKLKTNGQEQEVLLSADDYFRMKQAYLLGMNDQ